MDFLNKALAQFNEFFRSMSPGGRITTGLLLVVAVVSVGYLFQAQVGGGDDYLFGGAAIPTQTLQKMEESFGKHGLNGFSFDGSRVKVPHAERAKYLAALADDKAMPPHWTEKIDSTEGDGIFSDPRQQETNQKKRLMDELSLVISSMKGIERASVLIDSQQQPGIGMPRLHTASIAAQGIGGVPLDEDQVDKIRFYVTGAIAGMKPEDVTIADTNGQIYPGLDAAPGAIGNDPYAKATRNAERDLDQKVREALAYIQNLTVTSTVVLDHESGSRTREEKLDPKTVPLRSSEQTVTSNRESSAAGGAPGLAQQGGGVNVPVASIAGGKSGNESHEESKSEVVNGSSTAVTEKETYGFAAKSAHVSIGIPASYCTKVWQDRNPAEEGKEPKKPEQTDLDATAKEVIADIRTHVATLLPIDVKDPTTLVTVTRFPDIKSVEIAGPALPQRTMLWLAQNWATLAMVGLVLVSVQMLRSVLRGVPSAAPETATLASARVSAAESKPEEKEEPVEVAAARRLRRMTGSGPSLRDELSELVKEDPDSAANILRSWIGQVN